MEDFSKCRSEHAPRRRDFSKNVSARFYLTVIATMDPIPGYMPLSTGNYHYFLVSPSAEVRIGSRTDAFSLYSA